MACVIVSASVILLSFLLVYALKIVALMVLLMVIVHVLPLYFIDTVSLHATWVGLNSKTEKRHRWIELQTSFINSLH